MKKYILTTGASGFIGKSVLKSVAAHSPAMGLDTQVPGEAIGDGFSLVEKADLLDVSAINQVLERKEPGAVVHCAGIAHQKMGVFNRDDYLKINSSAALNLAESASKANPDVHFIFLSSICVYGEHHRGIPVTENASTSPSSDYAKSKLDAEKRLKRLHDIGKLKRLDILRLAPVYDSSWSLNLDRRVFAPKKGAYVRFGNGEQKMSAVSRQNAVDFIEFLISNRECFGERYCNTYNVCDESPYSFNKIIKTFKRSPHHPDRMVVSVPLPLVWVLTRLSGLTFRDKRQWLYSCYDKLAHDLVFENSRMLATGFRPKETLESVFSSPQIAPD